MLRDAIIRLKHWRQDNGREAQLWFAEFDNEWQADIFEDDQRVDTVRTPHYESALSVALAWIGA